VPGPAGSGDSVGRSLPEGFRVIATALLPPGAPPPDSGVDRAAYSVSRISDPEGTARALSGEPGVILVEPDSEGGIELTVGLRRDSRPDVLLDRLNAEYGVIRRTGLYREMDGAAPEGRGR
jgi:hypothetical protein